MSRPNTKREPLDCITWCDEVPDIGDIYKVVGVETAKMDGHEINFQFVAKSEIPKDPRYLKDNIKALKVVNDMIRERNKERTQYAGNQVIPPIQDPMFSIFECNLIKRNKYFQGGSFSKDKAELWWLELFDKGCKAFIFTAVYRNEKWTKHNRIIKLRNEPKRWTERILDSIYTACSPRRQTQ